MSSSLPSTSLLVPSQPFVPAGWQVEHLAAACIPPSKLNLGRFPTPTHRFDGVPGIEGTNLEVWIKRDDLSSCDLSGNKVRKLEFLMADAIDNGHDSVITIGGTQSNHCRATAVAARQLGMEPHLILRSQLSTPIDLTGNLLWNRMVGAQIHTVTPGNYARIGSDNLVDKLAEDLAVNEGKRPYKVPLGGSNAIGSFGYMELIREIAAFDVDFDHIVFACGSSGAGVAIGAKLAGLKAKLHGVGVCYDPQYFYNHINDMAAKLGVDTARHGRAEDWITVYNGQGVGYAQNTEDELRFLIEVARKTGIVFDPVYAGKALYYWAKVLTKRHPDVFQPSDKVLVVHTGGTFGLYDKVAQLSALLPVDDIKPMNLDS